MTMLAPEPEFVYRPLRVREPFAGPEANHYSLAEIAADIGVELKQDAFKLARRLSNALSTPRAESRSATTHCCWQWGRVFNLASGTR